MIAGDTLKMGTFTILTLVMLNSFSKTECINGPDPDLQCFQKRINLGRIWLIMSYDMVL